MAHIKKTSSYETIVAAFLFMFSDRKQSFFFLSKAHATVLGISLQTNRDSRHASFNGTDYLCKQKNKMGSNLLQKKQTKPVFNPNEQQPVKIQANPL